MSVITAEQPWIISRRDDLLWFQGSVVAGLLLMMFFWAAPGLDNDSYRPGNLIVMVLLLWGVLFDGTHVWATYARSYLATDQASKQALPGSWSWGLLLVGPALAIIDHALCRPGPSQLAMAGWLFRWFLLVAYLWAYWHLVRQHYGFLALYRRRAHEFSAAGNRLDSLILWTGCLYPYLRFSFTPAYAKSGLPLLLGPESFATARMVIDIVFLVTMTGLLALWVSGRIEPFHLGPKHLLLVVVISFHIMVFATLENLLTITATLTIFHNLQYHRIVWQYERGHGRKPGGGLIPYLAMGILLGLAWYGPRVIGVAALKSDVGRNILLGFGWGIAMHHYLVDGRIWRVRRSKTVSQALDAGARPA
jgi:hypothetical protein